MSITENFLILVLHVTLVLPLEGILLQNQDCGQCIAPLEHQVALLQQRLETLEQSKLMHFYTIILLVFNLKFKKLIQISEPHLPYKEKVDAHLTQTESFNHDKIFLIQITKVNLKKYIEVQCKCIFLFLKKSIVTFVYFCFWFCSCKSATCCL